MVKAMVKVTQAYYELVETFWTVHPYLEYSYFKILLSNSKKSWFEVKVQSCIVGPPSYPTHILFISCQSALPFQRYSYFTIWPWCYKFIVMGEIKGQVHIVGPTTYQLTPLSPEPLFRNMGWQIYKVKVMDKVKGQGHTISPASIRCNSFFQVDWPNQSHDMTDCVFYLKKHLQDKHS